MRHRMAPRLTRPTSPGRSYSLLGMPSVHDIPLLPLLLSTIP